MRYCYTPNLGLFSATTSANGDILIPETGSAPRSPWAPTAPRCWSGSWRSCSAAAGTSSSSRSAGQATARRPLAQRHRLSPVPRRALPARGAGFAQKLEPALEDERILGGGYSGPQRPDRHRTGASSGVGRGGAAALAGPRAGRPRGARPDQGRRRRRAIDRRAEVRLLDLASLDVGARFAADWRGAVDLLINNAGVMVAAADAAPPTASSCSSGPTTSAISRSRTCCSSRSPAGSSRSPRRATGSARSTSTTSMGARRYRAWRAYGQSKLANLLFTAELQRRLAAAGSTVLATAAHPGYAATNLQFHSGAGSLDPINRIGNRLLAQDENGGALPTLYAAVADVPGNSFAGPGGLCGSAARPSSSGARRRARRAVARRLWEVSEQLTGVPFPEINPAPLSAKAAPPRSPGCAPAPGRTVAGR